jgi:outer membrane protein OmpA-like peptidoglycan-associated protein
MSMETNAYSIASAPWRRISCLALAVLAGLAVSGCSTPSSLNPVEWYRDTMGISKGDPAEDAPNTQNLEAGGTRPYPNLASVPPPPSRALTTEERDALTQQLTADRANAKYIDEELRAGPGPQVAPPPRLAAAPSAPQPGADVATSAPAPAAPAPTPSAPPTVAAAPPATAAPPPAGPPPAAAPPAAPPPPPVAAVAPPAPAPPPAPPPPAPPQAAVAPPPAAAPKHSFVSLDAPPPVESAASAAPAGKAAAAPSRESPLVSPSVRSVPQPETPRAAPAPSDLAPGGAIAAAAPSSTPAVAPKREQLAARNPATESPAPPAGAIPVAAVTFPGNSTKLTAADQRILGEIVPLQQQSGAPIRVIGHAAKGRGDSVAQQLASFRVALDRANAVAVALTQAGIARNQILVETAPPGSDAGVTDRAEIFLEN